MKIIVYGPKGRARKVSFVGRETKLALGSSMDAAGTVRAMLSVCSKDEDGFELHELSPMLELSEGELRGLHERIGASLQWISERRTERSDK